MGESPRPSFRSGRGEVSAVVTFPLSPWRLAAELLNACGALAAFAAKFRLIEGRSMFDSLGREPDLPSWDDLENRPQVVERSLEDTPSEPLEVWLPVPYDVLVPKPEFGPNIYTLLKKGAWVPLSALKKPDGTFYTFGDLPRP